jgi:hypothetical protein
MIPKHNQQQKTHARAARRGRYQQDAQFRADGQKISPKERQKIAQLLYGLSKTNDRLSERKRGR